MTRTLVLNDPSPLHGVNVACDCHATATANAAPPAWDFTKPIPRSPYYDAALSTVAAPAVPVENESAEDLAEAAEWSAHLDTLSDARHYSAPPTLNELALLQRAEDEDAPPLTNSFVAYSDPRLGRIRSAPVERVVGVEYDGDGNRTEITANVAADLGCRVAAHVNKMNSGIRFIY